MSFSACGVGKKSGLDYIDCLVYIMHCMYEYVCIHDVCVHFASNLSRRYLYIFAPPSTL